MMAAAPPRGRVCWRMPLVNRDCRSGWTTPETGWEPRFMVPVTMIRIQVSELDAAAYEVNAGSTMAGTFSEQLLVAISKSVG